MVQKCEWKRRIHGGLWMKWGVGAVQVASTFSSLIHVVRGDRLKGDTHFLYCECVQCMGFCDSVQVKSALYFAFVFSQV